MLPDELAARLNRNPAGLVSAIVQESGSGQVLMLAWMNREAFEETVRTRRACYFSRSRNRLWRKGEESGNLLRVIEVRTDCDQDVLWLKATVEGDGHACHTGERSCFYRTLPLGQPASPNLRTKRG